MAAAFLTQKMKELFERHERIALQFSGGKDSMACLYLLRPWLDRITVYWVNAGDPMPETSAVIEECRRFVPHFIEVKTDVNGWREENGYPSDMVPTYSTPLGRMMGFGDLKVTDRFTCCLANIMLPMYERMKADGVTLVIRGQKLVDMPRVPTRSGQVVDGVEYFFPIEGWSHAEVLAYLKAEGASLHACYDDSHVGVDCMHCTAWWNEGHFKFLKKRHPETFTKVITMVGRIANALEPHCADLRALSELSGEANG